MSISERFLVFFILLSLVVSCRNSQEYNNDWITDLGEFKDIHISISPSYYDAVMQICGKPAMLVLHEDEKTMYAFIDKVIHKNGIFYILDQTDGRTVVAFDETGQPIGRYGTIGQGPGEYSMPYDIDVTDEFVYVLESARRKVIKYSLSGDFVDEIKINFLARAFKILDDGSMIFNLVPNSNSSPRICITDQTGGDERYFYPSTDGYVGGWHTNDIFRKMGAGLMYYAAPSDTALRLGHDGTPVGGAVFDFGKEGVPQKAKLDFLAARENGVLEGKMMLANSPIEISDSLWIGVVLKDDDQYTVLFNPITNRCGGRKFEVTSSVYDIIEPLGVTEDGRLISLLDIEFAEELTGFNDLDPEIKSALRDNNRVLVLHDFKSTRQ